MFDLRKYLYLILLGIELKFRRRVFLRGELDLKIREKVIFGVFYIHKCVVMRIMFL